MTDRLVESISEVLKGIYNSGFDYVQEGRLDEAEYMFVQAVEVSDMFGYSEGRTIGYESLANVAVMRGDFATALENLKCAKASSTDCGQIESNIDAILNSVVRHGIDAESKEDYDTALKLFKIAYPYLEGERREAVGYEIGLLEENDVE